MGQIEITRAAEFGFFSVRRTKKQEHEHDDVIPFRTVSFRLELAVRGPLGDSTGYITGHEDRIKKALEKIGNEVRETLEGRMLDAMDDPESHHFVPRFPSVPTTERIVEWLAMELPGRLYREVKYQARWERIRLWDGDKTYAEWRS